MKRIVQRTKGFEKAFFKLQPKLQKMFIGKLDIFLHDEFHPSLKVHKLKGNRKNEWSLSVTHEVRAIYRREFLRGRTIIIFTFIDIGSHSKVY